MNKPKVDFVFIANAWSAGIENPTSKHRIVTELARRGHRILWVEGAGMRTPSLGSSTDRGRMARKVRKALQGAVRVEEECSVFSVQCSGIGVRCPGTEERGNEQRTRKAWGTSSEQGTGDSEQGARLRRETGHARQAGGIWVVAPLFVPFPKYAVVRRFNGWLCRSIAGKWTRRTGGERPILVNYVPVLHDAMRGWPWLKVYHCVDRWDAFAMYSSSVMARTDEECCRLADRVIASSRDIETRCRRLNPSVRLITHGVDHAHFAGALAAGPRPSDLPGGSLVGFFGLLSEWIDQELVRALATQLPSAQIVLIGPADVDVGKLRGLPNVRLLGPRPFSALPAYIAWFDVCVIPFAVNDLTRAVNPIKLREMLAGGCPVVSTRLPEVEPYAGRWVDVADTTDAFIACVRRRIANAPATAERREISLSVAGETWAAKVDEMLEWIGKAEG